MEANLRTAEALVRRAHAQGAQIVLLQELFASLYFCQVMCFGTALQCIDDPMQEQDPKYYAWATVYEDSPVIRKFSALAKELQTVRLSKCL
jgi:N-carbamoylputrescine amidase